MSYGPKAAAPMSAEDEVVEGARPPWKWSELPGLGTENCATWQRQATPKGATEWRACITSERRPSLVCNQCGGSDAWHTIRLCEERR